LLTFREHRLSGTPSFDGSLDRSFDRSLDRSLGGEMATSGADVPVVDSLVARVRDAILRGELAPGERLVEAELTERFAASRGGVRQALVQLEGEGLVERVPNRGARVRQVTLEQAIEITEARAVLEGLCAAKAAERMTEDDRASLSGLGRAMEEVVDAGDVVGYSTLAQEIHAQIREISRQRTVSDLLERLRYQCVRFHFSVALLPGRPKVGLEEHLRVIEAVIAGDPVAAEQEMRSHLMVVTDALRQLGEQPGGQPLLTSGGRV
jgi:DNA-binding GntR family transcriptional regulator